MNLGTGLVARKTKGNKLGREAILWNWTLNMWILVRSYIVGQLGSRDLLGDEEVSLLSNWSWDLEPKSLCDNIVFKKKKTYLVLLIAIM